jgi:hypothetical protein
MQKPTRLVFVGWGAIHSRVGALPAERGIMLENNPPAQPEIIGAYHAQRGAADRAPYQTRHHLTMTGDHAAKKPAGNGGQSQHPRRNLP